MPAIRNALEVQPEFLTIKDAAIVLRKSEGQLRLLVREGTLAAVRLGPRSTRIPRAEIDRLIREAMA
jgi:excisionase family DNA binding protein